jgi:hypothetical protein
MGTLVGTFALLTVSARSNAQAVDGRRRASETRGVRRRAVANPQVGVTNYFELPGLSVDRGQMPSESAYVFVGRRNTPGLPFELAVNHLTREDGRCGLLKS